MFRRGTQQIDSCFKLSLNNLNENLSDTVGHDSERIDRQN